MFVVIPSMIIIYLCYLETEFDSFLSHFLTQVSGIIRNFNSFKLMYSYDLFYNMK